jgi:hypothetical protein
MNIDVGWCLVQHAGNARHSEPEIMQVVHDRAHVDFIKIFHFILAGRRTPGMTAMPGDRSL